MTPKIIEETPKKNKENEESLGFSIETPKKGKDPEISPSEVRIFSAAEKKSMCSSLKAKMRDMLITFGNIEKYSLPDLKQDAQVKRMVDRLSTTGAKVTYMTIAREEADEACKFPHFHLAIKFDSSNKVKCGTVKSKLYELFPMYHGNIDFSVKNTTRYIDKAKYLVCPEKDKVVDINPKVVGETYDELMKRIEKSAGSAKRRREIMENWVDELIRAAKDCEGSYEQYMKDDAVKEIMWDRPYQCISTFREIARVPEEIKEEKMDKTFPLDTYVEPMIEFFDQWFASDKRKGDCIIMQGKPDYGKSTFLYSWAKERGYSCFKAPASLRDWHGYDDQDIVIWDDMDEDRRDLRHQRITQLFDGQVTFLDLKYGKGVNVKCPKIIVTVNNGFDYYRSPAKFQARTTLCSINGSLLKNPVEIDKFPINSVTWSTESGLVLDGSFDGETKASGSKRKRDDNKDVNTKSKLIKVMIKDELALSKYTFMTQSKWDEMDDGVKNDCNYYLE